MEHLIGATILEISGLERGSEEVRFVTDKGTLRLYHSECCCESVQVEDVTGGAGDLIGKVVRVAEERTEDQPCDYGDERWTFYEIRTDGGDLTIRWVGESNGYYSIDVAEEWQPLGEAS